MGHKRQFCTFHLGAMWLGVEVLEVQEVLRHQPMTRVPLAPETVRGLINLRGQIVTAIDLRTRFGLAPAPAGRLPMNVVLRTRDGAVSLLVDEIGDVVEVDDDQHEGVPQNLHGVARTLTTGVFKLDGRLLLALDAEQAIASPPRPRAGEARPEDARAA